MIKKLLKIIIIKCLALLGFTSCDTIGGGGAEEYGVPYVTFKAMGEVTTEDGKPIENIQVVINANNPYYNDTLYTDSSGKFTSYKYSDVGSIMDIGDIESVIFNDVDAAENGGVFESKEIKASELDWELKSEGEGWFNGNYEVVVNTKLLVSGESED